MNISHLLNQRMDVFSITDSQSDTGGAIETEVLKHHDQGCLVEVISGGEQALLGREGLIVSHRLYYDGFLDITGKDVIKIRHAPQTLDFPTFGTVLLHLDETDQDVSSGEITGWNDVSGNSNDMTTPSTGPVQLVNEVGFLPAAKFDIDVTRQLRVASALLGGKSEVETFFAIRFDSAPTAALNIIGESYAPVAPTSLEGNMAFFGDTSGKILAQFIHSDDSFQSKGYNAGKIGNLLDGNFHTMSHLFSVSQSRHDLLKDGVILSASSLFGSAPSLPLKVTTELFALSNGASAVTFGEVIVFESFLSDADRLTVHNYLSAKWTGNPTAGQIFDIRLPDDVQSKGHHGEVLVITRN